MSKGLGPKQIAILELLKTKKYLTTGMIRDIYGYNTQAITALQGLRVRGYLNFIGEGKWIKGSKYEEAIEDGTGK